MMSKLRLEFNGISLKAISTDTGKVIESWSAISGRPGYQSASATNLSNTGPIPEGDWSISISGVTKWSDLPVWRQISSEIGVASPRGGVSAWGNGFVEVKPKPRTETFGRDSIYIHGGENPGSAGCIDLVGGDEVFFEFLSQYEGKIEIKVDYGKNNALLEGKNHPLLSNKLPLVSESFQEIVDIYDDIQNNEPQALDWFLEQLDLVQCFPAFTPILLRNGSTKPISDIRLGDEVLSFDAEGNLVSNTVTKLFRNTTQEFVRLTFDDGRDDLVATPGHSFLTETGDFLEIGKMAQLGGHVGRGRAGRPVWAQRHQ